MRIFFIHIHSHSFISFVILTGTNHKHSLYTCITKHSHWNTPTFLDTRHSSQLRVPQTLPLSTAYVYWPDFFFSLGTQHSSQLKGPQNQLSSPVFVYWLGTRHSSQLRVPQTLPLSTAYVYWLVFFFFLGTRHSSQSRVPQTVHRRHSGGVHISQKSSLQSFVRRNLSIESIFWKVWPLQSVHRCHLQEPRDGSFCVWGGYD